MARNKGQRGGNVESHLKPAKTSLQRGNLVWFVPFREDAVETEDCHLAAIVAKVNEDGTVNLCVITPEGRTAAHGAIAFVSHEEDAPDCDFACPIHAEGKKPKKKGKK